MKKIIFMIFFFICVNEYANSQSWESVYPKPTNKSITAVSILSNGNLIMGCHDSEIYKSTDNGNTWSLLFKEENFDIKNMFCVSDDTWYIFSTKQFTEFKFFKTTNGGNSFETLGTQTCLYASFINENTGWIYTTINGKYSILKTIDGGFNWNSIATFENSLIVNGISFSDENTGYIIGYKMVNNGNRVLKTTDGGISWSTILFPSISYYNHFKQINVFGEHLFVNASGYFARSTNAGLNWSVIQVDPVQNTMVQPKMQFENNSNGIIIHSLSDSISELYKTSNGGINWSKKIIRIYNPFSPPPFDFGFKNGTIFTGNIFGFYNLSNDLGMNWNTNKKFSDFVKKISALNESNIFLISGDPNSVLYKSSDLGNTWFIPENFLDGRNIKSIHFLDENYIVLLKSDSIYKSIDAGLNWIGKRLPVQSCYWTYYDMKFLEDNTAIITGSASCPGFPGYALSYISYDTLNTIEPTPRSPDGKFGNFINANTGYSVSSDLRFSKTTDRGINWQQYGQPNITNLDKYFVFHDEEIWGRTNLGISKTSDFTNWNPAINLNSGYKNYIVQDQFNVFVFNSGSIQNKIFKTTNRGLSWNSENFRDAYYFMTPGAQIEFINQNTGFLYSGHMIFKTTNGGMTTSISNSSSEVPSDFLLHQNYPNPFNPVTNIKFSLPSTHYTILKIFDIAGREIATLVNEQLNAGEYNYQFNADDYGLSSGVYFCKLQAGEFVESKRMMLIK